MKIRIDHEKCQAHNRCYMTCPEMYKIDSDGYAYIDDERVPETLKEKARRGAETCPERAITVTA